MSKTIREALDNYCETLTGQRPETHTILDSLNAITEANGGTPSQGGLVDAIDCFCACSGGGAQNVVFGEVSGEFDMLAAVTELVIPEGVTSCKSEYNDGDGDYFIWNMKMPNIKKITFPSTFTLCSNLCGYGYDTATYHFPEEVVLSDGITVLTCYAFEDSRWLKRLTLPNTLTEIQHGAVTGCTLEKLEIPLSVATIHEIAFTGSEIGTIIIHKPENSIAGAPWGAENAEVIWTG